LLDSAWDQACQLLQSYFANARDAYCIRVEQAWFVVEWEELVVALALQRFANLFNIYRGQHFDVGHSRTRVSQVNLRSIGLWAEAIVATTTFFVFGKFPSTLLEYTTVSALLTDAVNVSNIVLIQMPLLDVVVARSLVQPCQIGSMQHT
jgi:hypothetical protein